MITGAHAILYSKDSNADRAFLKDVLGLAHVDVGGGWLIFALPPSEVAVHPTTGETFHELYFMCDNINAFIGEMSEQNVQCTPAENQGWGLLTELTLPGGGKIGVYEPRLERP